MNNFLKALSFILIFYLCGCSFIQKSIFFKSDKKEKSWTFVNGKTGFSYYSWGGAQKAGPYSFSRDSIDSLKIEFGVGLKCISSGPPFLPVVPGKNVLFYDQISYCSFKINVNTDIPVNLDSLKMHIHFFINHSTVETTPVFGIDKTLPTKDEKPGKKINAAFTFQIQGTLNVDMKQVKTIFVQFDDEFNQQLKSRFKSITFYEKKRLHYFPFIYPSD
jgi:hypothetical protein